MTDRKERKTVNDFKKKLFKVLLILCIIMCIVNWAYDKYVASEMKVINKINRNLPVSVSVKDALTVKAYGTDKYFAFLEDGEYKKAYAMLTDEYKAYHKYDDYIKTLDGIDFSTMEVQEVKQMADGAYIAYVEYMRDGNMEETEYFIIISELNYKVMFISPDKFLYSFSKKEEFSKDKIKYTIENCVVYADKVKADIKIKNVNSTPVTLKSIGLALNETEVMKNYFDDYLIIEPKSEKMVEFSYNSNYYAPKMLTIDRILDEETLRTYTFVFENNT